MSGLRFPLASMFFVILTFVFFGGYAVTSFLLTTVGDEMGDVASGTLTGDPLAMYNSEISRVQDAFGLASLMSLLLIVISYIVDSLRQDDQEYLR